MNSKGVVAAWGEIKTAGFCEGGHIDMGHKQVNGSPTTKMDGAMLSGAWS